MSLSELLHLFSVPFDVFLRNSIHNTSRYTNTSVRAEFTWVVLKAQNTVEEPSTPAIQLRTTRFIKIV